MFLLPSRFADSRSLEPLEQGRDPGGVGDLPAGGTIGDVKGVDRRAFLGADPGKGDRNVFLSKGRDQFVEQAESIRSLNLNEGVRWMRLVFNRDARRKIHAVATAFRNSVPSLIQQRSEIEILLCHRLAQNRFHVRLVPPIRDGAEFRIANAKDVEDDVISAGVNVRAQNIERNDGK